MASLGTKDVTQSNVIAYEIMPEYGVCRDTLTFDNSTAQVGIGAVLLSTDNGDTWAALDAADIDAAAEAELIALVDAKYAGYAATTKVAIVIGGSDGSDTVGITATENVLCLVSGIAGVRSEFLTYTGTQNAANKANVEALVEGVMDMVRVEDSLSKN
jgi:hypothetical protein